MNVPKSAEMGVDEAIKLSRGRIAMLSEQSRAARAAYDRLKDSLEREQRNYNALLLRKAGLGEHPSEVKDPR